MVESRVLESHAASLPLHISIMWRRSGCQRQMLARIVCNRTVTSWWNTSAADFKFLQRLQQAREGTWNRKAAL